VRERLVAGLLTATLGAVSFGAAPSAVPDTPFPNGAPAAPSAAPTPARMPAGLESLDLDRLLQLISELEQALGAGQRQPQSLEALRPAIEDLQIALDEPAQTAEGSVDPAGAERLRDAVARLASGLNAMLGEDEIAAGGTGLPPDDVAAGVDEPAEYELADGEDLVEMEPDMEPNMEPEMEPARGPTIESVGGFVDGVVALLQKVREARAEYREMGAEDTDYAEEAPSGNGGGKKHHEAAEAEPFDSDEMELGEVGGVVLQDGAPVEGAIVTEELTGAETRTAADGTYQLRGLPVGALANLKVLLGGRAIAEGRTEVPANRPAAADFQIRPTAAMHGAAASQALRVLSSRVSAGPTGGGSVSGVVQDAKGKPAPLSLVRLDGRLTARTNGRGEFVFDSVSPGRHRVAASGPGSASAAQGSSEALVSVTADRSTRVSLRLEPTSHAAKSQAGVVKPGVGTTLRGSVRDQNGRAIAGASVTALQGKTASKGALARTASDGRFVLKDLNPGAYRVIASRSGHSRAATDVKITAGGTTSCELRLKQLPPASKTARTPMSRGETKATVQKTQSKDLGHGRRVAVVVSAQDQRSRNVEGLVAVRRSGREIGHASTTGGRVNLFDLDPGAYDVTFTAISGEHTTRSVTVRADATVNVRLTVQRPR